MHLPHRRLARLAPLMVAASLSAVLFAATAFNPATASGTTTAFNPGAAAVTATAAAPAATSRAGAAAASWQVGQLTHGVMGKAWGLTIDVGFMFAADGSHGATLKTLGNSLASHLTDYTGQPGLQSAGATAKALLGAVVLGRNPQTFGGHDLRQWTLDLVAPAGAGFQAGRLRDSGGTDTSNVFAQSYGVLGLARSGSIPQSTVAFLLKQRCSAGYFRLSESTSTTCQHDASSADVDATALALQALIAASKDGASVSKSTISGTADWLVSAQLSNGSYEEGKGFGANSNTTGLAAQALAAAGRTNAGRAAATWVAGLQITKKNAGNGPARPDIGAIAFDPSGLADGLAHGLGSSRAIWQRATPQAYFALVPVPLGTLTAP